jgi:hypothetical protein
MPIFAILAAIVWAVAAFHGSLGSIDLLFLGLCLLALHLAFGGVGAWPSTWRRRN